MKPLHVRLIGVNRSLGDGMIELELTSQRELGPDLEQVSEKPLTIVWSQFTKTHLSYSTHIPEQGRTSAWGASN